MTKPIKGLVAALLEQQVTIFEMLGFDERPEPRPPVDPATLTRLEKWWVERTNESLPNSYREFLLVCDGIDNFCVSYSLFGARDLLGRAYSRLLERTLEEGVGFEYEPGLAPVLIGRDPETITRAFFELRHERQQPGEPVVLEGDPGNLTLHQSFHTFLEARIETNLYTMAELNEVAQGRRDE
jgi:hypothetical protein